MIIEISVIFLQLFVGINCIRPLTDRNRNRNVPPRQPGQRSGDLVAPPLRRTHVIRRFQERPNVPIYPSRTNNQIPPVTFNVIQNPGAFLVNDPQLFWQAPQETNHVSEILEVEAVEIPIAVAEPIPFIARLLNFMSRNALIRFIHNSRGTDNRVDLTITETENEEDIPIIRLYEPQNTEPIIARPLRAQFY